MRAIRACLNREKVSAPAFDFQTQAAFETVLEIFEGRILARAEAERFDVEHLDDGAQREER